MAELIQYANGVPGIKWPLDKVIVKIGRSDRLNDISVDDAYASKSHAQIEILLNEDKAELEYYLRDLGSTNHTYLNQAIVDHVKLNHNDIVMVGKSKFVFLVEGTREYISRGEFAELSIEDNIEKLEESLASAVDEITREFKPVSDDDELDATVYSSRSGRYKFSRRLNIY